MSTICNGLNDFLNYGVIIQVKPNYFLIGWELERVDEPQGLCFFRSDFYLNQQEWLHPKQYQYISKEALLTSLAPLQVSLPYLNWTPYSKALFQQTFTEIQTQFNASQFEKIVPTIYEKSILENMINHRATLLFQVLSQIQSSDDDFLYGQWDLNEGIMGKSPEYLFKYNNKTNYLETMAIAGTSSINHSPIQLIQSAKDNHEHALVVQGIQETLQKWGNVQIKQRQTIQTNAFYHLYTPMTCQLTIPFQFDKILKILHPTPALSGYPQFASIKWLQSSFQHIHRQQFGAPFGFIDENNNYQILIAIRNIQWQLDTISIWAGCGIVPESNFENEWIELNDKISAVKAQFKL